MAPFAPPCDPVTGIYAHERRSRRGHPVLGHRSVKLSIPRSPGAVLRGKQSGDACHKQPEDTLRIPCKLLFSMLNGCCRETLEDQIRNIRLRFERTKYTRYTFYSLRANIYNYTPARFNFRARNIYKKWNEKFEKIERQTRYSVSSAIERKRKKAKSKA